MKIYLIGCGLFFLLINILSYITIKQYMSYSFELYYYSIAICSVLTYAHLYLMYKQAKG